MTRRTVVQVFCLSLVLVAPVGCSLFDRRPPRDEKLLPAPEGPGASPSEPGGPPAVTTSDAKKPAGGGDLKSGGKAAGPKGNEIEQVKAEEKLLAPPPLIKDDGPPLGPAKAGEKPTPPGTSSAPKGNGDPKTPGDGKAPGDAKASGELGAPGAAPPDPRLRSAPTAYGSVMQLAPGESPVERALELTRRLEELHIQKKALAMRLAALEEAIQERDRQITAGTRQVREATEEVSRARQELQTWADELREKQSRLRQQEKENQDLLKLIVSTLEKMAGPEPSQRPPATGP